MSRRLIGVFEVSAFFNDISHHAAEKIGLEGADFAGGGFDANFDADRGERERILKISGSDEKMRAVEIINPTRVGMASFDEFRGGIGGEGFQSTLGSF